MNTNSGLRALTCLMVSVSIPSIAVAQENAANDDTQTANQIIVTGTGTAVEESDALQAVDVLDAEEIAKRFDGSLGATLADLPGIATTNFGPAVGRPIIRGLGGDRVRILTNGIGLVDASTVSTDHAVTSEALEADRIEVLRGAAAIPYGGNAVGGVINVVDGAIPSQLPEGGVDGRFFAGGTTADEGYQLAGRVRAATGPVVFSLEGISRESGDVQIPGFALSEPLREQLQQEDPDEFEPGPDGVVTNSDFEFTSYGGGASVVGDWGYFGASVRQFESLYGLPLEDEERVIIDMEQLRVDVNGQFALGLGPFNTLTIAGGWVDYEHGEFAAGELATLFENDGYEARASLSNGKPGDRLSGSIGVQYSFSDFSAVGSEDFIPPAETTDLGFFVSQRLDLDGYGFEGGVRYETLEVTSLRTGLERSFDVVSGSIGSFIKPSENLFIGATLSRIERAPTNAELFSDGFHPATGTVEIGEATLLKETAVSLDGVVKWNSSSTSIEASAYYTDFSDFIFLANTGVEDLEAEAPIFQYFQNDATFWGFELGVAQDLLRTDTSRLFADLAVEYVRAETSTLGDVPFIPPFSTILGMNYERTDWELRTDLEIVADAANQANFELPTDGYVLWGVRAIIRPFGPDSLSIILSGENLLNQEARLNASQLKDIVPLSGRNLRATVRYSF